MRIQEFAGKNICILGYGREGKAMVATLKHYAPECKITIADSNESTHVEQEGCAVQKGKKWLSDLEQFDIVIKSPGIPPKQLPALRKEQLTNSTQIFLDSTAHTGAKVIGVTGSKGKSTTSSLIAAILTSNPAFSVFLIGNIGEPAIAHIADAKPNTIFVQEMSSYQLMNLTTGPQIAVITAFFPEHLDYHGSKEAYLEAKKNITRFQKIQDVVFYNNSSAEAKEIAEVSAGEKIGFQSSDAPVALADIKLQGEHNLSNIAAAYKVAMYVGIDPKQAIAAIKKFKGLPYRLESLGVHESIEWINDSISTTPESTIAALDALDDRVTTMILGGQDRGYNFSALAERIKNSTVQTIILLPDSGETIRKNLEKVHASLQCISATTMQEAVQIAKKHISKHPFTPMVLLSPASPSYGHFKNFEDRGDQFKKYIKEL